MLERDRVGSPVSTLMLDTRAGRASLAWVSTGSTTGWLLERRGVARAPWGCDRGLLSGTPLGGIRTRAPRVAAVSEPRTWPDLISALLRGQDLTPADTGWAMDAVMSGDAPAVALAGFLVALRAKGESAGEVVGLVDSMLAHAVRVSLPADRGPAVDTCGTVDVRLSDHDDVIELEVADDGIGFDPDAKALRGRHLGLTSMAERAALLDAELDVRSQPGAGTTVSLRVPAARHRPRGGEDP